MNKLDQIVTNNLKTTKDKIDEAIKNESTFDTNSFNLSSSTNDPLTVVTVSLCGGKKHRETTVAGITYLWDSGATNSTIKRKHTKHYECKMRSNKVEYSTATDVYCTTNDVKVPFCMLEFSSSKINNHASMLITKKASQE